MRQDFGLKARAHRTDWPRLARTPLPAIATLRDGAFMVIAKAAEDKVLVQQADSRPAVMTRAELAAIWDGGLILMTRRAGLTDLTRRFDITWFLGAIHKYRHLLGEVLVASFFLQTLRADFAAVLPGRHRQGAGASRPDHARRAGDRPGRDLASSRPCWRSCAPICLRTPPTAIDVELGARLFRHLLALPMAYFQARRVGDSVARVRELENIRNFLTSSALTLVIDLFFTFVFLAVMFCYSAAADAGSCWLVPVLHRDLVSA